MQLTEKTLTKLANLVADAVVKALENKELVGNKAPKSEKSAYQKTEQLLYNYMGFKRIVEERLQDIENIRRYGVPQKSGSIVQYSSHSGGTVPNTVLPEESVECAIRTVQESIVDTVHAISLVDNCMAALSSDPYYRVLEMRYFEGRTQEDIALEFGCSQVTISNNKSRLVRELSMRIFPNQTVNEILN
jgi:RNA polymerase sigma factor (sigma-70 family)